MLMTEVNAKDLPDALATHAWDLAGRGGKPLRIIVYCTSRDHAQKVQDALRDLAGKDVPIDTELFVGGRRVYERDQVARWLEERGFLAGTDNRPDRASFVIATAAGEVGVDLDADHAVCDLVAWERMVQRLGRVNRRGAGHATVIVVPAIAEGEGEKVRQAAVRDLLQALPRTRDGACDASPGALTWLKAEPTLRSLIERASTATPLHPPLTRALAEAWSMTSLDEHTGRPEVAPWVRGWPDEADEPQTTVVWRTHLPIADDGRLFSPRDLAAFRDAADPHLAERLETETWRVLDWLAHRVKTLPAPAPQANDLVRTEGPLRRDDVLAVILNEGGGVRTVHADDLSKARKGDLARVLPGATLVVDRRLRGLSGGLLKRDSDEDVHDVTEVGDNGEHRIVPFRIRRTEALDQPDAAPGWRTEMSVTLRRGEDGDTAWLIVESQTGQSAQSEEGRSGSKRAQQLDEHEEWAEQAARRLAQALALPLEYAELLAASARLHDEGKRAERWQRAFNAPGGGRPPYAKTTNRPNLAVLDGYRHELGSLPYAEAHPRVTDQPAGLRDLCLHLIAAHHGAARPLIRTDGAPEPPSRLVGRAQEIVLRFATLERTWGPWGLAWWEALLRAADQQASRRNDQAGGAHG
jgi:CRISPR-associated endonuclease/helicase Cas3